VATARGLLEALAEGHEEAAWERAQELAQLVLIGQRVTLAKLVLEGGPFAMRKAEELAEVVLAEDVGEQAGVASSSMDLGGARRPP
jgi:hypothetical protein